MQHDADGRATKKIETPNTLLVALVARWTVTVLQHDYNVSHLADAE